MQGLALQCQEDTYRRLIKPCHGFDNGNYSASAAGQGPDSAEMMLWGRSLGLAKLGHGHGHGHGDQ